MLNRVYLIGKLTSDPKFSQGEQTSRCSAGIQIDEKFKDKTFTTFATIVAFGKAADELQSNCKRGQIIFVEGGIGFSSYTDKNGEKKSNQCVNVRSFIVVDDNNNKEHSEQNRKQGNIPF